MDWLPKPRVIPKMKAVVTTGQGAAVLKEQWDRPRHGPKDILIKVEAIAVNLSDLVKIEKITTPDLVIGCDFAGTIEEVGALVMPGIRKKGDRVAGFLHGGVSTYLGGAFAEYLLGDPDLLSFIPDRYSFEEAAGLSLSGARGCQALFEGRPEPNPVEPAPEGEGEYLLVWDAATSVGHYALLMAYYSGYKVIATASPEDQEKIKALGPILVLDHADPETPKKIKEASQEKLFMAIDCICSNGSTSQIAQCFGPNGGPISCVEHVDKETVTIPENIALENHTVWPLVGKSFAWPTFNRGTEEKHDDGTAYAELLSKQMRKKQMPTLPYKLMPGGLSNIDEGLKMCREGQDKYLKIVYKISDTPTTAVEAEAEVKPEAKTDAGADAGADADKANPVGQTE